MRIKVLLGVLALALFAVPLVIGQGELVSGQSDDIKKQVDQFHPFTKFLERAITAGGSIQDVGLQDE